MIGRRHRLGLLTLAGLFALPLAAEVTESRTIEQSHHLPSQGRLIVDNVFGSIHLEGSDDSIVRLRVEESIEAEDEQALERARGEVELLVELEGDTLEIYVDGPFRDRRERRWRHHGRLPYRVSYDFYIQAPRGVDIEVGTVNDGTIEIDGMHGDFLVSNVNGGIELSGLRGSGRIGTVNGAIHAKFVRGPAGDSQFRTVNGDLDVTFPGDLSADLELETRFGELWSEFDFVPLGVASIERRRENGMTVIKTGGTRVRIAEGGPRLSFETLNGDVLIRRHDRGETP